MPEAASAEARSEPTPEEKKKAANALDKAGARVVGIIAWCLLAGWTLCLAGISFYRPQPYRVVWGVFPQQFIGGRVLAIASGLSFGLPKLFLIINCTIT